jgi:hypothetical protein
MQQKYRDLFARACWTSLQAGLAVITVEALDVPIAYAGIIAAALSALKSWVATKVGDRETVTFAD